MTSELHQELGGQVLTVRICGKITRDDYRRLAPAFEKAIQEHGKVRVLFEMDDVRRWTAAYLWAKITLDFKQFNDIERVALVGDKALEEGMRFFCKPFASAEARYFQRDERRRAWDWIVEGVAHHG
jgi:hypothetical protein